MKAPCLLPWARQSAEQRIKTVCTALNRTRSQLQRDQIVQPTDYVRGRLHEIEECIRILEGIG